MTQVIARAIWQDRNFDFRRTNQCLDPDGIREMRNLF